MQSEMSQRLLTECFFSAAKPAAGQVSDREKRASTSKRRSEPATPAATPAAGKTPARPPPEKRAKVAMKTPAKRAVEPVAEVAPAATSRSAKTRSECFLLTTLLPKRHHYV